MSGVKADVAPAKGAKRAQGAPKSVIDPARLLAALPNPILALDRNNRIVEANAAAEDFFEMGRAAMQRLKIDELLPFGSPVIGLIEQARERRGAVNEYRVDLGTPRIGTDRVADVHAAPLMDEAGGLVLMLQERTIADKMDRQLTHRGAARSISALGSMLAHEIKNPLAGIRGAAQLLETAVGDEDRALTRLICDETDRIVKLVSKMEVFSDGRPVEREKVNIHNVLDQVKLSAQSGFARHIRFTENYDPSLPPVFAGFSELLDVPVRVPG